MSVDAGIRTVATGAVEALVPGCRLDRIVPLTGGVSAEVFRLDFTTADGESRRVVLRRHRSIDFKGSQQQTAALEYEVLSTLHRRGLAVPEPFLVQSGSADAGSSLVMEWIDGTTEVASSDRPAALDQMACFLAELHVLDPAALTIPGLEEIEDPVSAVHDYLPPDRTTARVKNALDALASGWEPNRSVLIHGDYWPGNVIWHSGTLAAVVDWEDVCLGDPLVDLAAARVELACAFGTDAMNRFTDCYLREIESTNIRLRLDPLPVWEIYVSASALSTMHTWGLDAAEEAKRRQRTQRFFDRAADELVSSVRRP